MALFALPALSIPNPNTPYDEKMIQQNLADMKSPDENVRIHATQFFIAHKIPGTYDTLLDALNNEASLYVRLNLVQAISGYKNETAIPAMKKFLIDSVKTGNPMLIKSAYILIATVGGKEAEEIISDGLKSDSLIVKNAAVKAIGWGFMDIPRLLTFLTDKEISTRKTVLEVMGYHQPPEESYNYLQPLLAQKDDLEQYDALLSEMSHIADPRATDALITALHDDNSDIRVSAVKYLATKGRTKAIPAFIEALKDSRVGVRAGAAKALGDREFVDKSAFQPLLLALKDEAGVVSANAALSLGAYKDKDAIMPLAEALNDPYNMTRNNAVLSLFAIGRDDTIDIIGNATYRELDHTVITSIIDVMKRMKNKELAAKYVSTAMTTSRKDQVSLDQKGAAAYRQLTGNTLETN